MCSQKVWGFCGEEAMKYPNTRGSIKIWGLEYARQYHKILDCRMQPLAGRASSERFVKKPFINIIRVCPSAQEQLSFAMLFLCQLLLLSVSLTIKLACKLLWFLFEALANILYCLLKRICQIRLLAMANLRHLPAHFSSPIMPLSSITLAHSKEI